jgi:elongator complex protein 3
MNILEKIVKNLLKEKNLTREKIASAKRKIAGAVKSASPLNAALLRVYQKLLKQGKIKQNKNLELLLKKREIRTLSGVAPIAVLTKPYPCPGRCAYCPTEKGMPKSYLSNEPAVMRAIAYGFDPYRQTVGRIKTLEANGHPTDKLELIVIGGTWSALPRSYQNWFIKRCFDGANKKTSKNLAAAQKKNETAVHRIIGITLETRPDKITPTEIKQMRELGATRVELGVQAIDDKILAKNLRGHNVAETVRATKLLKDAGFKICYHLMPNLPGSTLAKDLKMFCEIFSNPNFQPDMVKIYPCVVTRGSKIYKWWKQGKYKPYSEKQLVDLLINIKKIIPPYVRVNRLIRDIPRPSIAAGNKISNLREIIAAEMARKDLRCKCIRCREVGHQNRNSARKGAPQKKCSLTAASPKLFVKKYPASGGTEYFISFDSPDKKILYAFVRLRIPDFKTPPVLPELKDAALIRELHTYGHLVPIDKNSPGATQHLGLGKKLMTEAEKIVQQYNLRYSRGKAHSRYSPIEKMAVISGIGVREYYKKLGYHLDGTYMVKPL